MEKRYKDLMANATKKIAELQSRLALAKRDLNEPVAIIGIGCRFPGGSNTPDDFWKLITTGQKTVGEIPAERWPLDGFYDPDQSAKGTSYCKHGNFLDDVFGFDAPFFNISPREALLMDPQQRLLLETAWRTFEHGGLSAQNMRQSRTGVFVGSMSYDFLQTAHNPQDVDVHSATGVSLSAASGRISHFFDLSGPTLTLDTACSSSLVAVHLGANSLRRGECDHALAGGVNVMTSPYMSIAESAANMLSPDGTCKTFDAAADGYGRGEGCGFVLLKRLSDAQNDNDRIIAVIEGSAVNHDGQSSALTVPNSAAQCKVMEQALDNAGCNAHDITYVEAHGTGTPLGDPIEITGLDHIYGQISGRTSALQVGSLKANIGHLEGAAGIAGLIKTALCVQHGQVPPHVGMATPNPHIDWNNINIALPTRLQDWGQTGTPRRAAISSFGFSGTNAHIVLAQAPEARQTKLKPQHDGDHLLVLSAKTKPALDQLIESYIAFLGPQPDSALNDICFSSAIMRDHFEHRFAVRVASITDALHKLMTGDSSSQPGNHPFDIAQRLYMEGGIPDWNNLYQGRAYQKVTLPGYRFQRKRYKLQTIKQTAPHHILGQRQGDDLSWRNDDLLNGHRWLLDHKIGDQSIFPAVAYLETVREAFHQEHPDDLAHITQIDLQHPLILDATTAHQLKTTFTPINDGFDFTVSSRMPSNNTWQPHAHGHITSAAPAPYTISFPDIRTREGQPGPAFYNIWSKRGNDWQGPFQAIKQFWRTNDSRIAEITNIIKEDTPFFAHPGTLDACGHLLADFAEQTDKPGRFVAQSLRDVIFHAPLNDQTYWSFAHLSTHQGRTLDGRLEVCSPSGKKVLSVGSCRFNFVEMTSGTPSLDQCLYETRWLPYPPCPETSSTRFHWLVVDCGEAQPFEDYLSAHDQNVERVSLSDIPLHLEKSKDNLRILYPHTIQSVTQSCADIATLAHHLHSTKTKIWIVTTQAWTDTPENAALWGLARTLAGEQSAQWGGLIDLDGSGDLTHLISLLHNCADEDQFQIKNNAIYVPRLSPVLLPDIAPIPLSGTGSYLITGGLGGIGLAVADMLVERGAQNLILMGRTGLPPRDTWDDIPPNSIEGRRIAGIHALEEKGATVQITALNIADDDAFASWYHTEAPLPIKGIIHAAGVATRSPLPQLKREDFAQQLSPKLGGLQVIDQFIDEDQLDFLIALSSVSALLNSPELGAYASANAAMDAFIARRRRRGKTGLSIAWGPWQDVGMAAEHFKKNGEGLLHPVEIQEGLCLLGNLLDHKSDYLGVLPFSARTASLQSLPICREIITAEAPKAQTTVDLSALSTDETLNWLADTLAPIFGLPVEDIPADLPLTQLGLDSLMAVEIKNAVEHTSGATLEIVDLIGGHSLHELAGTLKNGSQNTDHPPSAPQSQSFPLTPGQESLWLIHEMDADSPAYNVGFALHLNGPCDTDQIQTHWQTLLSRHSSLNSHIHMDADQIVQSAQAQNAFKLDLIDVEHQNDTQIHARITAAYRQPFDLTTGPLLRIHMFKRSTTDHILLITAHHIACDGWSLWLLLEEFASLCKGETLSDPTLSYADYAQAQASYLDNANAHSHWTFWQNKLAGPLPVLNLPTDRPRPPVQTYNGNTHTFVLDQQLTSHLKAYTRDARVTDYVTLLALYNTLLHRYSGQSDILVGCPTTGRTQAGYENIVGHFVNQVVMRSDLSENPSFDDLVQQTKTVVLEALSHQDYPFSRLVEKLCPSRDGASTPFFQTDFTLQQPQKSKDLIARLLSSQEERKALQWGKMQVLPYEIAQQEGQFDISFEIIESDGCFHCSLKYNTDLFDAPTMTRFAQHFKNLARTVLQDPKQALSDIDIMGAEEKQQVLVTFNNTDAAYPTHSTIAHMFAQQLARTPDKTAIVAGPTRWSYRTLNAKANQIAHLLRDSGLQTNEFVAIVDKRGVDFLAAILGIMKAGGAYVPVDPDYPGERIRYMLEDSQVTHVISRSEFYDDLKTVDSLRHVLLLDEDKPTEINTDQTLYHAADLHDKSPEDITLINTPQDRAYMIYTSGSTGKPKGAIVRHNGALNHIFAEFEAMSFHEDSIFLQSAPSSSDISIWQFLGPILIGGACVVADFATVCDAPALYDLICTEKVTVIELVPVVLDELIAHVKSETGLPRHHLEWGMVTGEAASVALVNRWFDVFSDVPLINAYGPSEAADDVCQYVLRDKLPKHAHNVPIGSPVGNMRMYVLDDHLRLLPIGLPGEICVSGIGVGEGYWQKPDKTATAFVPNPYSTDPGHAVLYRTGDTGRWLADGNLEYLGRNDDQVKIRGYRIELGEIDARLMAHPDVRQSLVTTFDDPVAGTALLAYVRLEDNATTETQILRTFLSEVLPPHMVPAVFVFIDHFPQLPNGKVDKKSLPAPHPETSDPRLSNTSGHNDTQRKLVHLWQEVLKCNHVGLDDNFFELGGHSLLMARLHRRIKQEFKQDFALVTLFQYPTIASLAAFLTPDVAQADPQHSPIQRQRTSGDIAIIAMNCRFPGAPNVETYWNNLKNKEESVTFFDDEELRKRGVPTDQLNDQNYVKGCAVLEGLDQFDAAFFGFNAREAEVMDPQHRLFLENAWQTLEQAGYADSDQHNQIIACFAGQGATSYLSHHVEPGLQGEESAGLYQVEISNDKDYIATITGYKLNLQGPCLSVQTACSTSLVAIHMACKSLMAGECDMALAGSISANVLHQAGYLYQDGMILSPDGHCRPFDAKAKGTIPGSGLGLVLLKPLERAQADGDTIHAVIKGSAINNDGALKAGYTAPSVEGQINVMQKAYANAGVDPASITYLCAHGTGTALGDPIEISALSQTRAILPTDQQPPCAIGSVKANIGHTDTAAGVASLIAAVMALKEKTIPAQLHFNELNPAIDLKGTPFFIPTQTQEWTPDALPRRAAISSLGIGGTNAHLIVEEAPAPKPDATQAPPSPYLLTLSAQSKPALDQMQQDLSIYLTDHNDLEITDVAYSLNVGRKPMRHRRALICENLVHLDQAKTVSASVPADQRALTFMFSGQGAQFAGMGRDLFEKEPVFREQLDRVLSHFHKHIKADLYAILWGTADADTINQTQYTQPLLFAFEYATARLLQSWGLHPAAMIGHSIGEYVTACLSGVFDLDCATRLVATRARLMQSMVPGAMCALSLRAEQAKRFATDGIDLAAANSSNLCVLSGPFDAMDQLEKTLQDKGITARRLHTSHAFHSASMAPLKDDFLAAFENVTLQEPTVPFISNLTGDWITPQQACDPAYWYQHLRNCVQFDDGLHTLMNDGARLLLEVGPGNALCTFAQQHDAMTPDHLALACHQGVYGKENGRAHLLHTLARLWTNGASINWTGFWQDRPMHRVPLPTYPFDRKSYWIAPGKKADKTIRHSGKLPDINDWFHVPGWQRHPCTGTPLGLDFGPWLIFADDDGFAQMVAQGWDNIIMVQAGDDYQGNSQDGFSLNPTNGQDYTRLFEDLNQQGNLPKGVLHFWSYHSPAQKWQDNLEKDLEVGFLSLLHIAQNLEKYHDGSLRLFKTVLNHTQDVTGSEHLNPARASTTALMKVIAQENPGILCQSIDFANEGTPSAQMVNQLRKELSIQSPDPMVAYRAKFRWVQSFEPAPPQPEKTDIIKKGATYLITGGLGYLGFLFAQHLAKTKKINLILLSRSALPPRTDWNKPDRDPDVTDRIHKVQTLEKMGATVQVAQGNIANRDDMHRIMHNALKCFGKIDGILHAAGVTDQDYPIAEMNGDIYRRHIGPKITGTLVLDQTLNDLEIRPDFVCLFSSLSSVLGGLRFSAYGSVNAFMDSYTILRNRRAATPWVSLCWDGWKGDDEEQGVSLKSRDENTITPDEGLAAFDRILSSNDQPDQYVISVTDLAARIDKWITQTPPQDTGTSQVSQENLYDRPDLDTVYIGAQTSTQQEICDIWKSLLGLRDIGIEDNFFELGGHSLLGTQLITRLRQAFAAELNISTLFENPTIAALANLIEATPTNQDDREELVL